MTDLNPIHEQSPTPKTSFKQKLRHYILHPELSDQQVAWSFAIGFSVCWNPLLGLHTVLILALCFLFRRLHMPLMFLAAIINNPWTMVPIATASAYMGNLLLGRGFALNLNAIHWSSLGWHSFFTRQGFDAMFRMLKPILAPYLLGGFVLSVLAILIGYYVMLKITKKLRRVHLRLPHLHMPHLHLPRHHYDKTKQGDVPVQGGPPGPARHMETPDISSMRDLCVPPDPRAERGPSPHSAHPPKRLQGD